MFTLNGLQLLGALVFSALKNFFQTVLRLSMHSCLEHYLMDRRVYHFEHVISSVTSVLVWLLSVRSKVRLITLNSKFYHKLHGGFHHSVSISSFKLLNFKVPLTHTKGC